MKKFFLFLIPVVLIIGAWMFFKEGTGCAGCKSSKDKFFFIVTPSNEKLGVEKLGAALKQNYTHFRVILWEGELNPELMTYVEKYPHRFEKYNSSEKGLHRLYRLIHSIPSEDVVVFMNPALNDPEALSSLNHAYQNKKTVMTPTSFYAGLFQRIKLEQVLGAQEISQLLPLMSSQLKEKPKVKKADLVVFSFDRPLQLYAYLESVEKFVKNLGETIVIYRTSHPEFAKGYEVVKKRFPKVEFRLQGKKPKKDFKALVLKAAFKSPNPYILFGVDDIIVRDQIDVEECVNYLEETGALGFYLRLGVNTDYCNGPQLQGKPEFQGIPQSFQINDAVFAWQFQDGKDDWKYPHTTDMTIFKKEDIRKDLEAIVFNNPNTFECQWSTKANLKQVGLYYKRSKMVNLPLNLVNTPENRYIGTYTAAQLLEKFKAGLKMDIKPLEKFQNCSAHTDFDITFVKRQDD